MKFIKYTSHFISIKSICKGALGLLGLVTCVTALSSPYSVYIANNNKNTNAEDDDILIDYTICNDVLENNPVCTQHIKLTIMLTPQEIELKNDNDVLYVWRAYYHDYYGQFNHDFSKTIEGHDKSNLVISVCSAKNRQLIALNTYGTGKIMACQVANY